MVETFLDEVLSRPERECAMHDFKESALLLIGLQNDYLSPRSPLMKDIEKPERVVLLTRRLLWLISQVSRSHMHMANIPIRFRPGHPEIAREVGFLGTIKNENLFQHGSTGTEIIPQVRPWLEHMTTLTGLTGFNAFVDTGLHEYLAARRLKTLVIGGCCTAGCIDSTARSAYELGYRVVILEDCTLSRTPDEQEMYCQTIFPIYSTVLNSNNLLASLLKRSQLNVEFQVMTQTTSPAAKAS